MTYNISDIFLLSIFIAVVAIRELCARGILSMEMLYTIAQENITVYIILAILLIFIQKNISPALVPTPIPITIDPVTQKLKQDILALQNKIAQMETEAEWRSEVRSRG